MYTLAFDTTTSFCSVALLCEKKVQSVFSQSLDFGQSELLVVKIKEILDCQKLNISDLSLISVCTGPGSFTGVRSSIALARTFGLGSPKTALLGVSAFDVYAASIEPSKRAEINAVIVETKRDDFYTAYYDQNLNKIEQGKTAFYDEIIADLRGKSVTFCGDGAERFLSKKSGLHIHEAIFDISPSVVTLAKIGLARFSNGEINFPKPIYLKAADICVK